MHELMQVTTVHILELNLFFAAQIITIQARNFWRYSFPFQLWLS